jgi:hypothetical protein
MKKYSIEELSVNYNNIDENKNYVCHVTTKEQHYILKQHFKNMREWNPIYNYYLLPCPGWCAYSYYRTIEFNEINFPDTSSIQEQFKEFKQDMFAKVDSFEQLLKQSVIEEEDDEYKLNDYVKIISDGKGNWSTFKVGDIFQIKEIKDEFYLRSELGRSTGVHKDLVRKATTEEISKFNQTNDFKEGDWLYKEVNDQKVLFRYSSQTENSYNTTEGYIINPNHISEFKSTIENEYYHFTVKTNVTKATTKQIEDVLTQVALWKGFKDGVKVNRSKFEKCISDTIIIDKKDKHVIIYYSFSDSLEYNYYTIYKQGTWAEIIKEENNDVIVDGHKAEIAESVYIDTKNNTRETTKQILFGPPTCKDSKRLTLEELKAIKVVMNLNKQFKYPFTIEEESIRVLTEVNKNLSKDQIDILINKLEKNK